jgi:hypothetical protein
MRKRSLVVLEGLLEWNDEDNRKTILRRFVAFRHSRKEKKARV